MKSVRHAMILDIIESADIETQEELADELSKRGIVVTQATVSRDIRELKLTKVTNSVGNYKYAVQGTASGAIPAPKFNGALVDSITKVSFANNIIVLKTFPGLANAIGAGIDAIRSPEILGCIAGDDTVMVVVASDGAAEDLADKIKHMMRSA